MPLANRFDRLLVFTYKLWVVRQHTKERSRRTWLTVWPGWCKIRLVAIWIRQWNNQSHVKTHYNFRRERSFTPKLNKEWQFLLRQYMLRLFLNGFPVKLSAVAMQSKALHDDIGYMSRSTWLPSDFVKNEAQTKIMKKLYNRHVIQSGRWLKQIHKGGLKKNTFKMKRDENEVQTDWNDIVRSAPLLHRTVQLYTPKANTLLKNEEIPKEMKSNKAPAIYSLTSGVVIQWDDESVEQINKNQMKF